MFASEMRALDREAQTVSVLQRKDFISKTIRPIENEMIELHKKIQKMLASETDQLNPSSKYYVMAEKIV